MIRVAVVGLGGRIKGVINKLMKSIDPEVTIVGVIDPRIDFVKENYLTDEDRPHAVFYDDFDEMVRKSKPDALAIGTPDNLHAPFAVKAAQYDIPLYLEKPVAVDMTQAVELEKAFANSKCPTVVSFPLRLSPHCRLAKSHIDAGAIGEPMHICATNYVTYGMVYFERAQYRDYALCPGLFLQKATHDLDYMSYLMGSPIVRVGAMLTAGKVWGGDKRPGLVCSQCDEERTCLESPQNRMRNGSLTNMNFSIDHPCDFGSDIGNAVDGMNEDCSSAVVEFASGAHGVYTQVFFSRRDAGRRGAIISGYHGTIDFSWPENTLRLIHHHQPVTSVETVTPTSSHAGGDIELARDFLNVIKGKGASRSTIREGLASVYACLAAKESAQKGAFVSVRQPGSL